MGIASHIAAVTTFCNRDAVWTAPDLGDKPTTDVSKDELVDGTITKKGLEETLGTALFSSRGQGRLGWSHQTYVEFLAAWHLCKNDVSAKRLVSLVTHPGVTGKVVPQLSETAAWLADMSTDVFRAIAATDPRILLRSDAASARTEDRQVLVPELLKAYDEDRLVDSGWDLRQAYNKLGYPGIANTLRPYVIDSSKGIVVRRVAIDIAESNSVQDLTEDLLRIALDRSEDQHIRVQAAYAIAQVGTESARPRLKELALGESGEDPDDELKACGLIALWPNRISAEELFAALTPPRNPNLFGLYNRFLPLSRLIDEGDLPWLVEWLETRATENTQALLAKLIARGLRANDINGFDTVIRAARGNRFLHAELSWLFRTTEVDSAEAAAARKDYEEQQELSRPRKPLLDPPPRVRVENALARFEAGTTNAFVNVVLGELTLEPDSTHYGDASAAELNLPGWRSADPPTRTRIVEAAKRYLAEYDPENSEWLGTDTIRWAAIAGYRALQLLHDADEASLDALSDDVWRKCAPIFLAFPLGNPDKTHEQLLLRAYAKAAENVNRSLGILARKENGEPRVLFVLQRLEPIWDSRVESTLVGLLSEEPITPASYGAVLEALLKHHSVYGIDIARNCVLAYQTHGLDRSRAVGAAVSLLSHCASAWEIVWRPVAEDAGFGLSVLSAVALRSPTKI
jgi:hypothetical protein